MTDLIPLDAAIAAVNRAIWKSPIKAQISTIDASNDTAEALRAIPAIDPAAIREAIARAWCHEENVAKEMDVDLADAVLFQILALIGEKK